MTNANTAIDFSKGYVGDLGVKIPTKVASMVNIDLEGEQTLNGIPVVENDIVLVNAQTDQTENGVYIVSTGEWNRAVWFNNGLNAVPGTIIMAYFGGGSGNAGPRTLWSVSCPDNPINFGTSLITFDFFAFASSPGVFLLSSNNLSDVQSASISRTNLGLAIGTNVQAYSALLEALSTATAATNTIPYFISPTTASVIALQNLLIPVGSITTMAGTAVPSGYLECDGSVVSQTTYSGLFAYTGTTWNIGGEGAGNFRLPDLRGYFQRGWSHGSSVDAGRAFASAQLDALQNITGGFGAVTEGVQNPTGVFTQVSSGDVALATGGDPRQYTNFAFSAANSPGAKTSTETRGINKAIMYCIKY